MTECQAHGCRKRAVRTARASIYRGYAPAMKSLQISVDVQLCSVHAVDLATGQLSALVSAGKP